MIRATHLATLDLQTKKLGNNVKSLTISYIKLQMNDLSARGSRIDKAYIVTNLIFSPTFCRQQDLPFVHYKTTRQLQQQGEGLECP